MLGEFRRRLIPTEKKYGLVMVSGFRELFPARGSHVTVIDEEGRAYETHMHREQARIDGLTPWYRNHPNANVGDTVLVRVEDDQRILIALEESPGAVDNEGNKEVHELDTPREQRIEIVPSLERMLEDILERNLDQLEKGLRIYCDEDGIPGRQYSTDVGIIDLLCVGSENDLVVVELKRQVGSDITIGQIARYMGWVKKNLAGPTQKVRGIIVAKEVDDKLAYALEILPAIQVRKYQIDLRFI